MSTRSTTHFIDGDESKPVAIIYRHSDGYPEGAGVDIHTFLEQCAKLKDSRFTDPSYLAAKYVVFLADMFSHHFDWHGKNVRPIPNDSKLEFISVGVLMEDPTDIEYRYVIDSNTLTDDGKPTVTCYAVDFDWKSGRETKKERVEIPQSVS
jgi:hypothetical protein